MGYSRGIECKCGKTVFFSDHECEKTLTQICERLLDEMRVMYGRKLKPDGVSMTNVELLEDFAHEIRNAAFEEIAKKMEREGRELYRWSIAREIRALRQNYAPRAGGSDK